MAEPEDPNRLETRTLRQLLAEDRGPESAEAAYRRGYRDGYIMAYNDLPDGPYDLEMQLALERIFHHWQGRLHEWEKAGRAKDAPQDFPPGSPTAD